VRSADKVNALVKRGAEVATGDATDTRALTAAFRGADAVYTLVPPNIHTPDFLAFQAQVGEATVAALRDSGAKRVVFLSSLGADLESGTGPIAGLAAQEKRLRALKGVDVLVLRPGYFFENQYATLGMIKHQNIDGGAMRPDLPISMIATRDIADFASRALRKRDWTGFTVRELLGPRDMTFAEVTRIVGERLGKPGLSYVQFGYDEFANALIGMGLSKSIAGLYAEMCRAFNEGKVRSLEGRRKENTTPTRFEEFVDELVPAYQAM
jgi:uncharacterized protein YbjT (DUF2867 family)